MSDLEPRPASPADLEPGGAVFELARELGTDAIWLGHDLSGLAREAVRHMWWPAASGGARAALALRRGRDGHLHAGPEGLDAQIWDEVAAWLDELLSPEPQVRFYGSERQVRPLHAALHRRFGRVHEMTGPAMAYRGQAPPAPRDVPGSVRRGNAEDEETISGIYAEVAPWMLDRQNNPQTEVWVGEDEAGLVSVGRLTKLRTGVGYINSIATAPRAARRGWASAITTQLVNRALEFGLTPALFYWERGLAPLYESVGFTHDGDWLVIEGPQLQFG